MQISVEQLVQSIVREVLAELSRRGVEIRGPGKPAGETRGPQTPGAGGPGQRASGPAASAAGAPGAAPAPVWGDSSAEIDMSGFRTPVLTENQLTRLPRTVSTIIVPCSTIVTPGAWDCIRSRKLKLIRKAQSH